MKKQVNFGKMSQKYIEVDEDFDLQEMGPKLGEVRHIHRFEVSFVKLRYQIRTISGNYEKLLVISEPQFDPLESI